MSPRFMRRTGAWRTSGTGDSGTSIEMSRPLSAVLVPPCGADTLRCDGSARRDEWWFCSPFAAFGWVLVSAGITSLPPAPYVVLDIAFDVIVVVALWTLYPRAWRITVALTLLGEISLLVHPVRNAVLLAMGIVPLALLFHPALRRAMADRQPSIAS